MSISSVNSSSASTASSTSGTSSSSSSGTSSTSNTTTSSNAATQLAAANRAAAQQLISALNAGSGVDVNSLAQNLVNAEEVPQTNIINSEIATDNSRISGYSALSYGLSGVNTAFTALKDENSFNTLSASSSNTSAFSLTTTTGGEAGSHQVSVTQLAQAQQTVSDGFASATTSLNSGNPMTITLSVGSTSPKATDIELPAGRDTPQDIVNFINAANTGVTAQLVNTGSGANPYEVVLNGGMGSQNSFTLSTKYSMGGVQSGSESLNGGKAMTLSLTVAGTAHSISLAAGHDTPQDIINAINASGTGASASLDASISGSTYPSKVDVTGPSGDSSNFSLAIDYGDGKGAIPTITPGFSFTASNSANQSAQDAKVQVDGINFTRSNNTLTDVIPGVTMSLNTTTTSPATVQMSRDTSSVVTNINSLVQAYNDANSIFSAVTDPKSTLATYGGTLVGDPTASMLQNKLRSLFTGTSSTPGTTIQALWQIGISIDSNGTMSVDSTKLNTALQNNYDDVVKMFTGDQNGLTVYSPAPAGIAGDAVKSLTNLLGTSGPLTSETNSANTEISRYQTDLTTLQSRMSDLLTRYQTQFAAMNSLVGSINQEKTSLSSSFAGMMSMYTGSSG